MTRGLLLCLILLFTCTTLHAGEISGRVVGVADGDTITILTSAKEQVKIRLHGIDAPERGQDFGTRAKQALSDLVFGKQVRIQTEGKDRYGRVIGTVFMNGKNTNLALVDMGLAWHYVKYSDSRELAQAQESAKTAQRGLWGASGQIPPWEYRAKKRAPKKPPTGDLSYWLNTGSGVRHNSTCDMFENTKRGRICKGDEGRACGICGG